MNIWAQRLYYQSARSLQIYFATLSPLLYLMCLYPLSPLFFYSVCPPVLEPLLLLCPQAQSQIDMLNSQLGH